LIMLKDNEHDYFSINIPIIVSWLWIIISVYTTISSRMHSWTYNKSRSWAYTIISVAFIARLIRFKYVADKNNTIINNNIKIYNKVIFEKLEEKEKSEKEYKEKITNLLDEIRKNTKK
jgi:membrane protein insertase Oxa1/YidC/SpoIIIJ